MNHLDFDDLEDSIRNKYLTDAYHELYAENKIPYGISTGDNDVWYTYHPVVNLARLNYQSSIEEEQNES